MSTDTSAVRRREIICGSATGDVLIRSSAFVTPGFTEDPPTERTFMVWSTGDYDRISAGFRHEAEAFVNRLSLEPGLLVLDAASGSGNLTIPAARTGACVTGLDIVPHLLDQAAAWAEGEGLNIGFDQGNVEELPYVDRQFDVVLSMFGVMFAARPERVVAELTRVTRSGGRVALANWTRSGFVGQMLAKHVAFVQPPAGLASPLLWGDEASIRERFSPRDWNVSTTVRTLTFRYPHTAAGTAELFRTAYGPTVRTLAALDVDRRAEFSAELTDLWTKHQQGTGTKTEVAAEYLEVIATRR